MIGEILKVLNPCQHQGEQHHNHHCAAVDQYLDQREELREHQQEHSRHSQHRGQQRERRIDYIARKHDAQPTRDDQRSGDVEENKG